jgi:hypothetical protein
VHARATQINTLQAHVVHATLCIPTSRVPHMYAYIMHTYAVHVPVMHKILYV